ncbi:hypothetical protein BS17DRAFT_768154 [Gyrodon lividus]|nr:hypothetical protein BS17DRAFT_768154 [Gyrodon lividus]
MKLSFLPLHILLFSLCSCLLADLQTTIVQLLEFVEHESIIILPEGIHPSFPLRAGSVLIVNHCGYVCDGPINNFRRQWIRIVLRYPGFHPVEAMATWAGNITILMQQSIG